MMTDTIISSIGRNMWNTMTWIITTYRVWCYGSRSRPIALKHSTQAIGH